MDRMHNRLLLAALAALLTAGCAQKNGDVSYVQPNYTRKADLLDGVWYVRNTVTKTPATTAFTFTGETGEMDKIVWEIQESHLIGYRAYAMIPGQDRSIDQASKPSGTTATWCKQVGAERQCVGGHAYYGAPVVIYPIVKQFDIQRGYNAATGETTNVISENASDRPWNEREFIRVDWGSQAAGANIGKFGILNPDKDSDYSGMIYANEPNTDPYDWPRQEFTEVNGEKKLSYFEFTGRYMAQPSTEYFEGYGEVPMCYFSGNYGGYRYDCTAQQIQMRTSIARVDPRVTNDYEPLLYPNDVMSKFGLFRTERLNYDRWFGYYESNKLYLGNRYRIWEHYFQPGADGMPDWSKPIPVEQREPKPIVYYVTPAYRMGGDADYQEYWAAAKTLEKNWNHAFQRAVAAARGQGNDLTGVPQMLYICPNPVPQDAAADVIAHCGEVGFEARFGDLRRSFLATIPEAVPNGLLGYGPSSADPETGEIISANANIYSAAVARSAQGVLDVINAVTGDISTDELIRGDDVKRFFQTHTPYAAVQGQTGPLKSALSADQVQKTNEPSRGAFQKPTAKMSGLMGKLRASGGLPTLSGDRLRAAAELLKTRPDLESLLIDNPEAQQDLLTSMPSSLRDAALSNPAAARDARRMMLLRMPEAQQMERSRQAYFAAHNICFTSGDYVDRPMTGLAYRESMARAARVTQLMANEGKTAVEARDIADAELKARFRQHVWRATAEHEIGHTFGLRHNFAGSFDAVNYFDPYWALRQENLTVEQGGVPVLPRTPADLKNVSDGTEAQLFGAMQDYEYSSIMDYGGKSNADWMGLGKYDEAAIVFAYSGQSTPGQGITASPGYVEVFAGNLPSTTRQFDGSDGKKVAITGAAYDVPVVNALHTSTTVPNYTERFHYSTVPFHFGQGPDIEATIADGLQNLRNRKLEKWSEVKAKEDQLREKLAQNPTLQPEDVAALNVPAEVPYMFCTDDHAGSVLSCNRWDRGPDYYEMTRGWLEDYWNGYFFNHFRRDRYGFTSDRAVNYAFMTFDNTAMVYKHWVHAMYGAQGQNAQKIPNYVGTPFGYDSTFQDTWTMATMDGINDLLKVMSMPAAGLYALHAVDIDYDRVADLQRWDVLSEGVDFDQLSEAGEKVLTDYYASAWDASAFTTVPRGEGRRMYSRYDYKSGFGFWDRLVEVGHYNDQIGAIFASVMPQANFLGVDQEADQNRYMIPYYLTFKDELTKVYGGLWSNDEFSYDPTLSIVTDQDGKKIASVQAQVQVRGNGYVQGFDYPAVTAPGASAAPLNVQTTWTARIYALYLGMALFDVNYDLDYAKANQIIKLGGAEDVTVPAGWEKFEVEDFVEGTRYAALQPVGATSDTPAVRMIKQARQYAEVAANPAKILSPQQENNPQMIDETRTQYTEAFRSQIRDMDIARGMYSLYGKAF